MLAIALESGFTHFDTSPYYGLGLCESLLGREISSNSKTSVTSKVGLYPALGVSTSRLGMVTKKVAGRLLPGFSGPAIDWAISRARTSLDGTLKRLRRDALDVLMLHEPDAASIHHEEWLRWLESERQRVRHFGLAGEPFRLAAFVEAKTGLDRLLQTRDSVGRWEADCLPSQRLAFTYGYVSTSPENGVSNVAAALAKRTGSAVIVATRRAERLLQFAKLLR